MLVRLKFFDIVTIEYPGVDYLRAVGIDHSNGLTTLSRITAFPFLAGIIDFSTMVFPIKASVA